MSINNISKNSEFEIEITGMTHEGMGVGRYNNLAVFVQGAITGEIVKVKIIKVLKTYAVARILEFIKKSEERIPPFCPVFKRCGGCSLQHMTYEKQLEFKHQVVEDSLKRIGGFSDIVVHPVIGMIDPYEYRNKAQYPVGTLNDIPVAGFFARRTHEIIDYDNCRIQNPFSNTVRNVVLEFIKNKNIPVYDEKTGRGTIRHIVTRFSEHNNKLMVIIVSASKSIPYIDELISKIKEAVPNISSIILNINKKIGNAVLGDKNITVFGEDYITDHLLGYDFIISPLSFYQVNPIQTEVLYNKVVEYADLKGSETLFDLYCGIGTISILLAGKAKKVIGVEIVEEAIISARKNVEKNNVNNIEFYEGNAEKVVNKLYEDGIKADVVVVDPPRKGCEEGLLDLMVKMQPEKIVYVSCMPSTLARDLRYLCEKGYAVLEVQAVDMFPHTEHVETVVLMSRVKVNTMF